MHLRIIVSNMSTIAGAADALTYYCVVYKYHSIRAVGGADASCYTTGSYFTAVYKIP